MSRLPTSLSSTALYPVWVALAGMLLLFVGLGSYGLWEPHEVRVADRANDIANPEPAETTEAETSAGAAPTTTTPDPNADKKAAKKAAKKKAKTRRRQTRSELSETLVARAIARTGRGELGSRAPLAILALITILATFFIGLRVGGPRAGLYAALIVMTFPALLMHGRHLTSEIGSAAGSSLTALGLLGILCRRGFSCREDAKDSYPIPVIVIDLALVAVGVTLSYHAAGALLGVIPPLAGIGAAGVIALLSDGRKPDDTTIRVSRAHFAAVAAIGVGLAVAFFAYFVLKVFDLVDLGAVEKAKDVADAVINKDKKPPADGWAILGGRTFVAEREYVDALAGVWRTHPDLRVGFSSTLEGMAFGAFPWIAAVPIAGTFLLLGRPGRARSPQAGRAAIVLWALAAYAAGAIFSRKVGVSMYPAWGALAAMCGVWLADIFRGDRHSRGQLPLAAFFVLAAAFVVGKDLITFPEKLTSLNLTGATLEFPKGVVVQVVWIIACWLSALGLVLALAFRDRAEAGSPREAPPAAGAGESLLARGRQIAAVLRSTCKRYGLAASLGFGIASAVIFTQVLTPALSSKLSAKNILGVYQKLRVEGDVLGIMGNASGASYYAGTEWERIRGRTQLIAFLERPTRVFALAPAGERCPLNKAARKQGLAYHVVDDSSAQFLLYSNQLKPGESDRNPLIRTFFAERPEDIRTPVEFTLDDRLDLVGVSMPDTVRKGSTFKMKLFFKVNKPVTRNWKVFVHFDGGGVRFQADHDPIGGTCGTAYWLPGDYVVDEFEVTAGSRTHPKATYTVYAGMFVGSAGNWTNMKVTSKGADKDHRIPLGTIKVR